MYAQTDVSTLDPMFAFTLLSCCGGRRACIKKGYLFFSDATRDYRLPIWVIRTDPGPHHPLTPWSHFGHLPSRLRQRGIKVNGATSPTWQSAGGSVPLRQIL